MNDQISQEEIDKLLKEPLIQAEVSPAKPVYNHLTTDEADTLGEICNIFMGSASTTLSMLLGHKVDITTPVVCEYETVEDSIIMEDDHIVTEIEYIEGLEGTTVFALKRMDTAVIADLMMGGEGKPDHTGEIGEIELSAVGEAMNQMVGSASTSLSSMFNYPINISHPVVKQQGKGAKVEITSEIVGIPIIAVKFRLIVGTLIDSEIIQIMSLQSAQKQVLSLMNMMNNMSETVSSSAQSSQPEPPPPPIPQSTPSYQTPPMQQSPPMAPPAPVQMPQRQEQPQQQVTVQPVQFASFDNTSNIYGETNQNLNLVLDVKLELTVELGRTVLPIKNVLELTRGSIIELDKIAGEPVELYANGKLIAKGEVVVIEDNFGLRITNIVSPEHRVKDL